MSTTQKEEVVGTLGSDLDEYVAQLIRCEKLSENGIRMICDKVKIPLPLSLFGVLSSLRRGPRIGVHPRALADLACCINLSLLVPGPSVVCLLSDETPHPKP